MAFRSGVRQSAHDRVIQVVAAAQTKHDAYTNPGPQHNCSVRIGLETVYPDLVLCKPGTMSVDFLIEVETEDSMTEAEASQWATYARGPGSFWLLVPSSELLAAQTLCWRKGIAANFGCWWNDGLAVGFRWLKAAA